MKNLIPHLTFAITLMTTTAQAVPTTYQASDGKATFEATGKPSLLTIKGHGAKAIGTISLDSENKKASGEFEVSLNDFDSGIALRDRHMKEKYLETEKYPKAVLKIDSVDLPDGFAPGKKLENAPFKGKLTVKDVEKDVAGTVSVSGVDMKTEAKFAMNLKDYPIGVPTYMGITIADQVEVQVEIPKFEGKK